MLAWLPNRRQERVVRPDTRKRSKVLESVSRDGMRLRSAPENMKADREIVVEAIRSNGLAVEFASESFKDEEDVVSIGIDSNVSAFQYASPRLQQSLNFVSRQVAKNGLALQYASYDLQANWEVVMTAVSRDGNALRFASPWLREDKEIASAAVKQTKSAYQFVSPTLQEDADILETMGSREIEEEVVVRKWRRRLADSNVHELSDKEIALKIVAQDRRAFEQAPESLRGDKDIVLAAVSRNPEMLKFALGGLNQDRDCWIAAGLWNEDHEKQERQSQSFPRIALSTRFSLGEDSKSTATKFTKLLNENSFFRDGNFDIYSPNAFCKGTCDPEWTRMSWPCRGTFETCKEVDPSLKTGKPQSACCWRYSFRWHLEESRKTRGFMLQVVDLDGMPRQYEQSPSEYALGDGQKIETVMAKEVGTKVFRIYRPRTLTATNAQLLQEFRADHVDSLASRLAAWYDGNCADMEECEVLCEESFGGSS